MTIHSVQISLFVDPGGRDADTLLEAWPTLPGVAAGVARAGVGVTIVQASARRQTIARDGVSYHFVDDPAAVPTRLPGGLPWPRRPRRILDCVRSLAPDIVHVHGLQRPMAIRQLARTVRGVPVMVQDHGVRVPRGWRRPAWSWALRDIAGVTFVAREQAAGLYEAGVLRADLPLFEVMEGSSNFTPGDQLAARSETGIGGDPCFLWTGHLNPNKDPLTLLEAFRLAADRLPEARLWCCFGVAPLREEVERRIAGDELLRRRVTLLGRRPHGEMERLFRAADFLVQMSHVEAGGYSLIEALSCGTTPLVTDIPSFRRICGEGRAGSLTPVGDARAMADAMIAYAARDRAGLRRAARAHFEDALSFDAIGRQLRGVYETLLRRG
jgi:glycosyltransferase involved in cell wall biosynthesis